MKHVARKAVVEKDSGYTSKQVESNIFVEDRKKRDIQSSKYIRKISGRTRGGNVTTFSSKSVRQNSN